MSKEIKDSVVKAVLEKKLKELDWTWSDFWNITKDCTNVQQAQELAAVTLVKLSDLSEKRLSSIEISNKLVSEMFDRGWDKNGKQRWETLQK